MFKSTLLIAAALILACLAGPMAVFLSSTGERDSSNIYVFLQASGDSALTQLGLREVSPYRTFFARIVFIPPDLHLRLVESGYVILPAGALAEICGAVET